MMNELDFEELNENIELELFEVLETELDGIRLLVTLGDEKIITRLSDNENEACHMLELEDFKKKDLQELNKYINNVWYYN